jgi:hypothetical protein
MTSLKNRSKLFQIARIFSRFVNPDWHHQFNKDLFTFRDLAATAFRLRSRPSGNPGEDLAPTHGSTIAAGE